MQKNKIKTKEGGVKKQTVKFEIMKQVNLMLYEVGTVTTQRKI